jgi:hypothetical protein
MQNPFLNYDKPTARIHLNRIKVGDVIGIGLYQMQTQKAYVLIYDITGQCIINTADPKSQAEKIDLPGVNCQMKFAITIERDGSATVQARTTEDYYDQDKIGPFVQRLVSSVHDITEGYPWKPHFLPMTPSSYDKDGLENFITEVHGSLELGRYEDFEEACRQAYKHAKINFENEPPVVKPVEKVKGKNRTNPSRELLPVATVYDLGDHYVGSIYIHGEESKTVAFRKTTIGSSEPVEYYLTGKDLEGKDILEIPSIMALSPGIVDYDRAHVRFLTVNF